MICRLAAGPSPAHLRGTRRKYVRVGAYAASMPRKVPRGWAGKDQWRWSVCTVRAVRHARCPILDVRHTRDKQLFTSLLLVLCSKGLGDADASAAERLICRLAAGPLSVHPRRTRRKYVLVGSYAASMPRKVPRGWAGKDQWRWSVCTVRAVRHARCPILDVRHTRDKQLFTSLLLVSCSKGLGDADASVAERLICRLAAGPLSAHHRRTRRKYVLVSSYAASMPRKVPRR